MKQMKAITCAGIFLAGIGLYSQEVAAESFTGNDFLKLPPMQQKFWIIGAVEAAAIKSADKNCVYNWYFNNQSESHATMLAGARKYNKHKPIAILFSLLKYHCKNF